MEAFKASIKNIKYFSEDYANELIACLTEKEVQTLLEKCMEEVELDYFFCRGCSSVRKKDGSKKCEHCANVLCTPCCDINTFYCECCYDMFCQLCPSVTKCVECFQYPRKDGKQMCRTCAAKNLRRPNICDSCDEDSDEV